MKKLRRNFNRFCYRHRDKGIPNLMLYICVGTLAMYFLYVMDPSNVLPYWLYFDRDLILKGQVWRLVSYVFLDFSGSILLTILILICYYSLGQAIENLWGSLRFTLFYFSGVLLMDVYCLIFDCIASSTYLHLSLFLAYATIFPEAQFTLFLIIPIKARYLALLDLFLILTGITGPFPGNLFPLIALGNYFLFMGSECLNLLPMSWKVNAKRTAKKAVHPRSKTIPFNPAGSYQATHAKPVAPYTHKCTVCGRTDTDNPDLEFRYCSKCRGYHCYCQDHISNHAHITK